MNKGQSGTDRREQTGNMVKKLIEERNHLWQLYCGVAGLEPFTADKPIENRIQDFCQSMVDYLALSHFGIYQRIASGQERRQKVVRIAETLYPAISKATEVAVEFNDKYEHMKGEELLDHLSEDLSQLGEQMALRNDLEDHLLEIMTAA